MPDTWLQRSALRADAEPEAKPSFEPVSEDAWNKAYSTGMLDLCGPVSHEYLDGLVFNE